MERIKKWVWVSIVDYLKSQGQDSSKEARVKLAAEQWIENYNFSAWKNTELLNKLAGSRDSWTTNIAPTLPGTWSQIVDQSKVTYWKDTAVDNIIASQYINKEDKLKETYIDKVGMETGLYADIQGIDNQIEDTYRILWMPDRDIFSRRDLSPQEKIALSRERRDTAVKRNTHLRTLQQAKQKEISDLAKFEADKEREKQASYKSAMDYQKQLLDQKKFELEEKKFWLTLWKAEADVTLKQQQFWLDVSKFELAKKEKYFSWIPNKVLLDTPDGTILKTRLSSVTNPNQWKECWEYVNDVMGWSIGRFWDTYTDKLNVANEQYWGIWAAAVWNPGNTQYGHVWVIVWEQGTNWVIKSSNLKSDGTISTDLVPKSHISGYKNVPESSGKKVEDVNFTSVADFNKSTVTHKVSKITNETANSLIIQDMWDNKIGSKNISAMLKNDSISQELVDDYTNITYWIQFYTNRTDDQIVAALKEIDFKNMSKSEREDELLQLAVAGKLNNWDDELFEWGYFDIDENGYEVIDEYFDDVHKSIKEANQRAEELRKKYNIK